MANYIKISDTWQQISGIYKKVNGIWVLQSGSLIDVMNDNIYEFGGVIGNHTLVIISPSTIISESSQLTFLYDGESMTNGSWSVTSGFAYASISNTGLLTINPSASNSAITISVSYGGASATKDITVTYQSGTQTETEVIANSDGSTTETTVIQNEDGSSQTTSVTTDENGNITESNETTVNPDGSSTNVNVVYNEDGSATQNTTNTDTSGNAQTQTVEVDENGNETVTGYVIDTTANEDGGLELPEDGIDTGFIAFDGSDFTIHLKVKYNPSENVGKYLFTALEEVSSNKYAGFALLTHRAGSLGSFLLYTSKSGNINTSGGNNDGTFGSNMNLYNSFIEGSQTLAYCRYQKLNETNEYTVDFYFCPKVDDDPKHAELHITPLAPSTGGTLVESDTIYYTSRTATSSIPDVLQNATVSVGTSGVEHNHDMVNAEVLEFTVSKGRTGFFA